MRTFLRLLRAEQWYKNFVIFLPLFFAGKFLEPSLAAATLLGFVVLCLTSSSSYILNDVHDRDKDRRHPEKKTRPIAAGRVSPKTAGAIAAILLAVSLATGMVLSPRFAIFPVALFLSTLAYTFYLKSKALIDVHVIAVNYLLRSVSGAVLIDVPVTPWLILSVFFLALFLALGKRRSELALLGEDAAESRVSFSVYTKDLLDHYIVVVMATLLFSYSLYTFFAYDDNYYMMATIPFASFMLFRYTHLIFSGDPVARKTHYVFADHHMMVAFVLWLVTSFAVVYHSLFAGLP